MKNEIISALNWRYAVQVFAKEKKVSAEDLQTILESGRLAPSSYGFEPWKFIIVENPEIRLKLQAAGYGQTKISEASHLIVLARRTDARANIAKERIERTAQAYGQETSSLAGFREMLDGSIARQSDEVLDCDMRAQIYIALGVMVETASLLNIDSAPMGGFDPVRFDEILGLGEQHLSATVLLALGYRGEDEVAKRPKVRRAYAEVVSFVK
jgi:nitroreductase